jgi:hypothetical protein
MHILLQRVAGGRQIPTHTPPAQIFPWPQSVPQLPQWNLLVMVSKHWPAQSVWPVGQLHLASTQNCPTRQTEPQPPQFVSSVCRFTQLSSQEVRPVAHDSLKSTTAASTAFTCPSKMSNTTASTRLTCPSKMSNTAASTRLTCPSPGRSVSTARLLPQPNDSRQIAPNPITYTLSPIIFLSCLPATQMSESQETGSKTHRPPIGANEWAVRRGASDTIVALQILQIARMDTVLQISIHDVGVGS